MQLFLHMISTSNNARFSESAFSFSLSLASQDLSFSFKIYPASYLIEENNQLPDLYTKGHLTVYTTVLFAPLLSKSSCVYNGMISDSVA